MAGSKKGLGKGLGALIFSPQQSIHGQSLDSGDKNLTAIIDIFKIIPNPNQPRKYFDEDEIEELAQSIKEQGILQPILVREKGAKYELIAGERRLRAAKKVQLKKVPVIIKNVNDEEALELTIVENLQRENLNPIEEAAAYKTLAAQFSLTHEQIAKKVGKNRATITNSLRLLELPKKIQDSLKKGAISSGHARALLSVAEVNKQVDLWKQIINNNLSVRDVEALISIVNTKNSAALKPKKRKSSIDSDPALKDIKEKLIESLGTKVEINGSSQKGRICIHYFSQDDLERIISQTCPQKL